MILILIQSLNNHLGLTCEVLKTTCSSVGILSGHKACAPRATYGPDNPLSQGPAGRGLLNPASVTQNESTNLASPLRRPLIMQVPPPCGDVLLQSRM